MKLNVQIHILTYISGQLNTIKCSLKCLSFIMLLFFRATTFQREVTWKAQRWNFLPLCQRKLGGGCEASRYSLLNSQTMCRIWNLRGPPRCEIKPGTDFNMHRGIFHSVKAGPFALVSLRNLSLSFCGSFVFAVAFFLVCRLQFFSVIRFIPPLPWDNSPGGGGKRMPFPALNHKRLTAPWVAWQSERMWDFVESVDDVNVLQP